MQLQVPTFLLARRGRVRVRGVRTAKLTAAATLAYLVAEPLSSNPTPILAPLTALLVVQLTLYDTLRMALSRVGAVVLGVLIASVVAGFVPLTAWSLGLVIGISLVVGRLLRVGEQLTEVAISAMLVLAVGGQQSQAAGRVTETLIGTAVGVLVGAVVAPPLYVRPASDALVSLAASLAEVLRGISREVGGEYTREQAGGWLDRARGLGRELLVAERELSRAESSLRLNPRAVRRAAAGPSLRTGLETLEHATVSLRGLARSLADRAAGPSEEPVYGDDVRGELSTLMDRLGEAVERYGRLVGSESAGVPLTETPDEAQLRDALASCWESRHRLRDLLRAEPRADGDAWELHGSLLANVDRLLREIDVEARAQLRERWKERRRRGPRVAAGAVRDRLGRAAATGAAGLSLPPRLRPRSSR